MPCLRIKHHHRDVLSGLARARRTARKAASHVKSLAQMMAGEDLSGNTSQLLHRAMLPAATDIPSGAQGRNRKSGRAKAGAHVTAWAPSDNSTTHDPTSAAADSLTCYQLNELKIMETR